jgi:hypothetical protein
LQKKYEQNPFVEGNVFKVPMKQRSERLETAGPMAVISSDGEVMETAEIRRKKVVDSDRFVKLFVAHLDAFFDLKPGTMKLMAAILDELSQTKNIHGDTIYLNYKRVSGYFEKRNAKPPAKGTFFSAMTEMTEKGFVAPSVDVNLWFINPAIFFNGDRIRFVTELRRKKVSQQELLEERGQTRLPLSDSDASPEGEQ